MSSWQKVFEDKSIHRAEIVKSILTDRDMNPVLINKQDTSYQFGHFEVHVAPDYVLQAIRIVKEEIKF